MKSLKFPRSFALPFVTLFFASLNAVSGQEKEALEKSPTAAVDHYATFDLVKIEKIVKAFLESKTVDNRIKFVRHPERVKPLMTNFYGGQTIKAEGLGKVNFSMVSYRGRILSIQVETADFDTFPLAIERIGEGDKSIYLVDWESWVGHGDLKPKEMYLKKPVAPTMMRFNVSISNYYNYHFSDDEKWQSYKLESRDPEFPFTGFTKRNSKIDQKLADALKGGKTSPFLVKVVYPADAKSKNLVEIVEIVNEGWVIREEPKKKSE